MTPDPNLLRALADLKTVTHIALLAGDMDTYEDARRALAEACECFRTTYCPDATSVHVTCDRTTGRPLRVFALLDGPRRLDPIYYEGSAA